MPASPVRRTRSTYYSSVRTGSGYLFFPLEEKKENLVRLFLFYID
jgi:hypothetical protein